MDEGLGQDCEAPREVERASRAALFLGATIEVGGRSESGRVRNVSETGAMLETSADLPIGSSVTVSFRGVERCSATVKRWTTKGYGIQFVQPIDPDACRQPVSPLAAKGADFLLNLRETNRRPIWDTNGSVFKRPGTKT